jgi:hypothetical protein
MAPGLTADAGNVSALAHWDVKTTQLLISEKTGGTRLSRPTKWDDENLVGPHSLCGRWYSWIR